MNLQKNRSTVLRFCNINIIFVRQLYVFATSHAGNYCKIIIFQKCSTVLRFCDINIILVRQLYVFATSRSGNYCKTMISRNSRSTNSTFLQPQNDFCSTVLRFWTLTFFKRKVRIIDDHKTLRRRSQNRFRGDMLRNKSNGSAIGVIKKQHATKTRKTKKT